VKRVTVNKKGTLMASSSKDETIIVWNMDRIKSVNQNDAIISILSEHKNIIDCIKWATQEACTTINNADYNLK
jgi:WD40 repeat protein